MPYKSEKQRAFMEGCRHNPAHMGGKCPDKGTLDKFHADDRKDKARIIRKGGK